MTEMSDSDFLGSIILCMLFVCLFVCYANFIIESRCTHESVVPVDLILIQTGVL
jgi:hypothetical protein